MPDHTVTLVSEGGVDSRHVTATLSASGELVIAGVDAGPLVELVFGDGDYEFWFTVSAELLPVFMERVGVTEPAELLDSLVANWSGERFGALQEVLGDVGARFFSY